MAWSEIYSEGELSDVSIVVATAAKRPSDPQASRSDREGADILEGKRVLIVEDEFFVAVQIEDALQSFGCETSGPYSTLELAGQASRREPVDIAILDINLNGEYVYPLADELRERGIPFVFLTGYASTDLPEVYRSMPRLQKPFDSAAIRDLMQRLLASDN